MVMKPFVATALLLAACAPAVGVVHTTSASVDTLQVTNAGAAPATPDAHEQPAQTKTRTSGAAYLLLGAVVLMPFIILPPSSDRVAGLYFPIPTFAPASSLPSGELPSTVETVSTLSPEPTVTTPQIITTPPTIATPQASTTERTVFGVPIGKAWTP